MQEPDPAEQAQQALGDALSDASPLRAYSVLPVVGLGGSAGAVEALCQFLSGLPAQGTGCAFVAVLHERPRSEAPLDQVLQAATRMPVLQLRQSCRLEADTLYLVPPGKSVRTFEDRLQLTELPRERPRRHTVDQFFCTLGDSHGPRATAVVLSGAESDGALGLKRIKERGGLTVVQDPGEADHDNMPRAAVATGMVDWVLPAAEMGQRILQYYRQEPLLRLPPDEHRTPAPSAMHLQQGAAEASLREVLAFLRTRTGRDFHSYKRATLLRRIARRMQVNGVADLPSYLGCLRTRAGEAGALLQDLLISVTQFFRDPQCFAALEAQLPQLFAHKRPSDTLRVWVAACATGEEAYSVAMLLAEHARTLEAPPVIQVFATDLDDAAVQTARGGHYPESIEADVSEQRLRRFFIQEHGAYRVRRELREMVLFAAHDVLVDSPFSRLDLITCRNLLIYFRRDAQQGVLDTFHFSLQPGGLLFLGSSESVDDGSDRYQLVDKEHRLYRRRITRWTGGPAAREQDVPPLDVRAPQAALRTSGPTVAAHASVGSTTATRTVLGHDGRAMGWAELHFRLLEALGPPSVLVDSQHDIVHLSASAGRFLQFGGGEPSRSLLRTVRPELRIELRAALYQAAQSLSAVELPPLPLTLPEGTHHLRIRVIPAAHIAPGYLLVQLHGEAAGHAAPVAAREGGEPLSHHLEAELERLKSQLRDTVEQYEASTEELKASNEELQAMNEELRSATEELETSREELQSINEELTTVNHELKSKVDELGKANSDIQNLMDATCIATVFLDRQLCITRFTPSAVRIFNLIATDVGRPLSDLKTRLDYPGLADDARGVLERLSPMAREVGSADDAWFLVRALPYRTLDDRIAGVVLTFVDITERKRNQAALELSRARLEAALQEKENARAALEAADVAKDRFLAVLSHELRNPLASIHSSAHALAAAEMAEPQRAQAAEVVLRQSGVMKGLLDELLDVSRLRLGRLQLNCRAVDLADVVQRAVELVRPAMLAAGHTLELSLPSAPLVLHADPLRLGQVLSNLLTNAARYTPNQGRIRLRARTEAEQAVIEVEDNGIGMARDRVDAMFEMFTQGATPQNRHAGGLGIGLALVRKLVELHEGQVTGSSEGPGRGSIFTVRLPLTRPSGAGRDPGALGSRDRPVAPASAVPGGDAAGSAGGADARGLPSSASAPDTAAVPAAVPRSEPAPAVAPRGIRVLVADDNADAAWSIAALLRLQGFEVHTADGGRQALALASALRPQLALLDLDMPDLSGHEVARRLRAQPWGASMRLLAASGLGQVGDREAAAAAGFDAHLVKPVELAELVALLQPAAPSPALP